MKQPIDPLRLDALNKGTVEAKNLMESLAIDFCYLLSFQFPDISFETLRTRDGEKKLGITQRIQLASRLLYQKKGIKVVDQLMTHPSDTLRSLVSYILALHSDSFEWALQHLLPLADDLNSGVREWAWMGIRPLFAKQPLHNISFLQKLTESPSERIRRFASELSRPRGVWCTHIKELRTAPWEGLPILNPLQSDPARYVQLSVGNWLNDAAKDHPAWVQQLCTTWRQESPTAETEKICKRGLRNI